jgi:hypothetical protein
MPAGDAELGAQAARNKEIHGVHGGLSVIN